jgi:outer membrane protein assembly factor BamC
MYRASAFFSLPLETRSVILSTRSKIRTSRSVRAKLVPIAATLAVASQLVGCSTIENFVGGDKVDYKTSGGKKSAGLEIPPDLTQLARDPRYQPSAGVVSANAFQAPAAVAQTSSGVVTTVNVGSGTSASPATAVADMRIERSGNQRWLSTPLPAEMLWPQLQTFWAERGFVLITDQAEFGVMETEWAENRAKLPQDIIRQTIGRVFDSLYSTGERDKFRTRVERTPTGTEVYISHRGLAEVFSNQQKDSTIWQPRPADHQLEAEFLQRLMVKLGAKEEQAKLAVATGTTPLAKARAIEGASTPSLQMDEGFDRAWRRVGLALDRSGFTVEDRDRSQGTYFVRYVDPSAGKKDEPGLLTRIFSFGKTDSDKTALSRYRVTVKADGERSVVAVLRPQGNDSTGDVGKRIVGFLVDELK